MTLEEFLALPESYFPEAVTEAEKYIATHAIGGDKQKANRRSAPAGQLAAVIVSKGRASDFEIQTDQVMCCHCGKFWTWQVGSGRARALCGRCGGISCGPMCPVWPNCVPYEEYIANIEAGRPVWTERPVKVSTGGVLLGT
jgi:hypothetical protein